MTQEQTDKVKLSINWQQIAQEGAVQIQGTTAALNAAVARILELEQALAKIEASPDGTPIPLGKK